MFRVRVRVAVVTACSLVALASSVPARADVPRPRAECALSQMKPGLECVDCKINSSTLIPACEKHLGEYGFKEVCNDWGYMHGIFCRAKGSGDGKLPPPIAAAVNTGSYDPSGAAPEPTTTATGTTPTATTTSGTTTAAPSGTTEDEPKKVPASAPSAPTKTGCGACETSTRSAGGAWSALALAGLAVARTARRRDRARRG